MMKKFEIIYLDIEEKIQNQTYAIHSILPSEHQLSQDYGVSRETIRKVLRLLEEKGYIQKKQGLGSIVIDFQRFSLPISGLTSYKELQKINNFKATTRVIQNKVVSAPAFLLHRSLDIQADERFIHLIRSRAIDGQILIVDEDYIRMSVVQKIPDKVAEDSIYHYFEQDLKLQISYAQKEIRAEQPKELEIALFDIDAEDYLINVKSYVYLEDTTFFQYTISHHRLEKFVFSDFARRKHRL